MVLNAKFHVVFLFCFFFRRILIESELNSFKDLVLTNSPLLQLF